MEPTTETPKARQQRASYRHLYRELIERYADADTAGMSLREATRVHALRTLREHVGDVPGAAKALGRHPGYLFRLLRDWVRELEAERAASGGSQP